MQIKWSRRSRAEVRRRKTVLFQTWFTRCALRRRQRESNNAHRLGFERRAYHLKGCSRLVYELCVVAGRCRSYSRRCVVLQVDVTLALTDTTTDLIGDVITLACWKLSRRPPSELYPYGFGKFEVLGSAAISLLLTGGAVGLGLHSLSLLGQSLSHVAVDLPAGVLQDVLVNVTNVTSSIPTVASDHGHEHALDPNAAWFAGIGIIAKEWLYRATKKVADEESSSVLLANAVHHRSDAYSSLVALVAILGTWWFPSLPLDPIGGEYLIQMHTLRRS